MQCSVSVQRCILVEVEATHVEPRQTAPWLSEPASLLSASTLLAPIERPHPVVWRDCAKVVLLIVQLRGNVVAEKSEETRDGKGFVAIAQNLKIDVLRVVVDRKHRDGRVNWYHQEDANDSEMRKSAWP